MMGVYTFPILIGNLLATKGEVAKFFESMIEDVCLLSVNHKEADFIPTIVYNEKGKCFNTDYNFMVNSLSNLHGEVGIKNDFSITEGMDSGVIKNATFLVAGILEGYYGVVRINPATLDMSRYTNKSQKVDISTIFYNVICIKNGRNVRRFSAVPFSVSSVKNLVSEESFNALMKVAKSDSFEQVVFGKYAYEKYVLENVKPTPVWS
jgi:hypothetical protein